MDTIRLPEEHRQRLEGQQTVSDKIRLLNRLGYARADIARILRKRYQHVRNVLEQDRAKQQQGQSSTGPLSFYRLPVDTGGAVSLPEPLVRALGLGAHRTVIAREVDGEVHLLSPAKAMGLARALLDPHVRDDRLLSEELLRDRRAEVDQHRTH